MCTKLVVGLVFLSCCLSAWSTENKSRRIFKANIYDKDNFGELLAIQDAQFDADGYLWLSHGNQLLRFDGYHYYQEVLPNNTVIDSDILYLHIQSESLIWFVTNKMLYRWQRESNTLSSTPIPCEQEASCLVREFIVQKSRLFLGTDSGLYTTEINNNELKLVDALKNQRILTIEPLDDSTLWFSVDRQIGLYNMSSGQILASFDVSSIGAIYDILPSHDRKFWWVAAKTGLYRVYLANGQWAIKKELIDLKDLSALLLVRDRQLWIGTEGKGIFTYDVHSQELSQVIPFSNDISQHNELVIFKFFTDANGGVWALSQDTGLLHFGAEALNFAYQFQLPFEQSAIGNNRVFSYFESSDGGQYMGHLDGGLSWRKNWQAAWNNINYKNTHGKLPSDDVLAIAEDDDSNVLIGTRKGLAIFDPANEEFKPLPFKIEVPVYGIKSLDDATWLLCHDQIIRLSKDGKSVYPSGKQGLAGRYFTQVFNHLKKRYVMSDRGIHLYENGQFVGISATKNLWATSIVALDDGFLLGTMQGLYRMDSGMNKVEPLQHALLDEARKIVQLIIDKEQLWVVASNTVFAIPISDIYTRQASHWRIKPFDHMNALLNTSFNFGAFFERNNGQWILGTNRGIVTFEPFSPSVQETQLQFSGIESDGHELQWRYRQNTVVLLDLPFENNGINLRLSTLDFPNISKSEYQFRFRGDKTWQTLAESNRLTLPRLDMGERDIEVRARIFKQQYSDSKTLKVNVARPIWLSLWAYFVYGLLLIAVHLGLWHLRNRHTRRKNLELELIVKERTKQIEIQRDTIAAQSNDLKHLITLKDQMLVNVAHELKTPISLILGSVQALDIEKNSNKHRLIELAEDSGYRLLNTIQQLLDIDRYQQITKDTAHSTCNLSAIAARLGESFDSILPSKQLKLVKVIEDGIYTQGDDFDIEKIIINLLSNAIKYTPSKGEIKLLVFTEGDQGIIDVIDSGEGIPLDQRQHIFERFIRLDCHRHIAGSGVGLTLVKQLTESLNGRVEVLDRPEKGAHFRVKLPLTTDIKSLDNANGPADSAGVQSLSLVINELKHSVSPSPSIPTQLFEQTKEDKKRLILIVDDNKEFAELLQLTLSKRFSIEVANNGEEGIEKADRLLPDLIISDVKMPVLDGFELCEQLKKQDRTMHIPIIIMTAQHDAKTQLTAYQMLADAFVEKPFHWQRLFKQIDSLMETRSRIQRSLSMTLLAEGAASDSQIDHIESSDKQKLEKIRAVIEKNISDKNFSADNLAEQVAMSRRNLDRHMVRMIGSSGSELIKLMRLKRAKVLIQSGMAMANIADELGFSSQSYFSRAFSEYFKQSPREYKQSLKNSVNQS